MANLSFAQMDFKTKSLKFNSLLDEKIYIIEIDDYQIIKIIKLKDSSYVGSLINVIWKSNGNGDRIKLISKKVEIPSLEVKKIMEELELNGFETIPDGETVKGYIVGTGGVTISLTVKKNNTIHKSSYWEPQSNLYYRNTQIPEILKVRLILKIINAAINYEQQYNKFAKALPDGQYVYGSMSFDKRRKRD